jgi:hypothetical protein
MSAVEVLGWVVSVLMVVALLVVWLLVKDEADE